MHPSGVWLYGSPDEVFYRADDSIVIWDHKTAHPKDDDQTDRFLPQYHCQVNGYGLIAEDGLNLGRVSAGALCYWDIQHKSVVEDPAKFIRDGMLHTAFVPHVHPVEIDYSRIDKLLKEAIKIWKSKVPPEGRKGYKDCKKLEALLAVQSSIESELSARDQRVLWMNPNDSWIRQMLGRRLEDRRSSRLSALHEVWEAGDSFDFDEGGMVSNWEFLES